MKRISRYLTALSLFVLPLVANAQVALTNPLGTTDIRLIVANIIKGALSLSGIIALLMVLYGGFLWLTSTGEANRVDKGKKVLVWATLGIVVIASAYIITLTVFRAILQGNVNPI